jgi:hypothetical protein
MELGSGEWRVGKKRVALRTRDGLVGTGQGKVLILS